MTYPKFLFGDIYPCKAFAESSIHAHAIIINNL